MKKDYYIYIANQLNKQKKMIVKLSGNQIWEMQLGNLCVEKKRKKRRENKAF